MIPRDRSLRGSINGLFRVPLFTLSFGVVFGVVSVDFFNEWLEKICEKPVSFLKVCKENIKFIFLPSVEGNIGETFKNPEKYEVIFPIIFD